jgi:hypothetical protein
MKALLFWLIIILVGIGILMITHFFPIPDEVENVMLIALGGGLVILQIVVFTGFLIELVKVLVDWVKARIAKNRAYNIIESHYVYSTDLFRYKLNRVVPVLKKWNDREARHLLNDLYELERKLCQSPKES